MSTLNQDTRLLRIETPVGKDAFIAVEMKGEEEACALFNFSVELLSTELEITPAQMVGQKVTLSIHYNKNHTRYFHGIVNQFNAYGVIDGLRRYTITMVPSLWLLSLNQSSTLYAEKTTKDIVTTLLKKVGVDFKYNASTNDKREYCIQYQETDLEFVTRLLAEEGLGYYFSHKKGKHEMIIVDKNDQYVDCEEKQVECEEDNAGAATQLSRIIQWQRQYQMHTGKLAMTGYLESKARKGQNAQASIRNSPLSNLSKYERGLHESAVPYRFEKELPDYGSKITQKKTAELILETEQSRFDRANGSSNCCTFVAGGRFELKHRIKSESGKYLLTHVSHYASANNEGSEYQNHFTAVPAAAPLHLAPPTNRHRINGPQLATVLKVKAGDSPGSNDPQLMVKLCFYWDEKKTSCWVRVMQNFAGASQGAVFVPRVDSEVVVEFIGGDPDRPLVTGAVYNATNKAPPYSKTQSGFKTGSKHFNEFRFDDKADAEEIYLRAGKDFNYAIVNDEVGEVGNDKVLNVVGNKTTAVEGDHTTGVEGDHSTTVEGDHSTTVEGKQTNTIKGNHTTKVDGHHTIESAKSITFKVGSSKIVIDNSSITFKATKIKGTANATLELKGSASAKLEGGSMVDVKASGMLNLKGSLTKIN